MTAPILDRRALLRLLAALASHGLVSSAARAQSASACATRLVEGIDAQALYSLGGDYLSLKPGDPGIAEMRKLLSATEEPVEGLAAKLREQMRADFSEGRVVALSRVFVSRTEARILAALNDCLP